MSRPRPPLFARGEPYVEVRRSGRWSWYLTIHDGVMQTDGRFALGSRERADRKAARWLARYRRDQARWNDVHEVRS